MTRRAGGRSLAGLAVAFAWAAFALAGAPAAQAATPVISDLAGTGTAGPPTAGAATSSKLNLPSGVAVDASGNLYVADTTNNEVEKVTPAGVLSIVAGTGTAGAPTAGTATASKLSGPQGVAVDGSGNVYIADTGNNRIEKVTSAGSLSLFAGTGTAGAPTAGAATSSKLNGPQGVAVDGSGNVYIADTGNSEIEKVTSAGSLSLFAGTGTAGAPTAGAATSSKLNGPQGVAVDGSGNVYIADTGNSEIEKVTSAGSLSLLAGTGTAGAPTAGTATASKLNGPQGVAVDGSGNVYIADTGNDDVEEVSAGTLSLLAGTGAAKAPTYGGAATSSGLNVPTGVAVDSAADVDIADSSHETVDQVNVPGTLSLTTTAAPTFSASLDSGNQAPTYTLPLIAQNTGAGAEAGWDLTITSTTFTSGGTTPATLATTASSATGVTSSCASGSCVAATNGVTYPPLAVPAAGSPPTAVKLFQAQTGSGIGTFTVTPTIQVAVPQNSYKGSYTSTVTVSVVSGP